MASVWDFSTYFDDIDSGGKQSGIEEVVVNMAYLNNAWLIYVKLRDTLTANISDLEVFNVYRFPDLPSDQQKYTAETGSAALFRMADDELTSRFAGDCEDRTYTFEVRMIVDDTEETQQMIMDLSEQAKYHLLKSVTETDKPFVRAEVGNVLMLLPPEATNLKQSIFNIRVLKNGI